MSQRLDHLKQHPELTAKLNELTAGSSRSAFAERFARRVGRPPVGYATNWRMRVAASQIAAGLKTISEVASQAGYLSDSAFHAAFRREMGASSATYRRKFRAS